MVITSVILISFLAIAYWLHVDIWCWMWVKRMQKDTRSRLCYSCSRSHGDSNLCLLQCRGIINTITSHGWYFTLALKVLHNLTLVCWLYTWKQSTKRKCKFVRRKSDMECCVAQETVRTFHRKEITLHLNKLLSVPLESTHQTHGLRKIILRGKDKQAITLWQFKFVFIFMSQISKFIAVPVGSSVGPKTPILLQIASAVA